MVLFCLPTKWQWQQEVSRALHWWKLSPPDWTSFPREEASSSALTALHSDGGNVTGCHTALGLWDGIDTCGQPPEVGSWVNAKLYQLCICTRMKESKLQKYIICKKYFYWHLIFQLRMCLESHGICYLQIASSCSQPYSTSMKVYQNIILLYLS